MHRSCHICSTGGLGAQANHQPPPPTQAGPFTANAIAAANPSSRSCHVATLAFPRLIPGPCIQSSSVPRYSPAMRARRSESPRCAAATKSWSHSAWRRRGRSSDGLSEWRALPRRPTDGPARCGPAASSPTASAGASRRRAARRTPERATIAQRTALSDASRACRAMADPPTGRAAERGLQVIHQPGLYEPYRGTKAGGRSGAPSEKLAVRKLVRQSSISLQSNLSGHAAHPVLRLAYGTNPISRW